MNIHQHLNRFLPVAFLVCMAVTTPTGAQATSNSYVETLDATATYTRGDCLGPCACAVAPVTGPAVGTFTLVFNHADQWTHYYDVLNVQITASTSREAQFTYTGSGTYEIGGDFAYSHRLILNLVPSSNPAALHHFDSGYKIVPTGPYVFPALSIEADSPITGCTQRKLQINTAAVPFCPADIGRQGGLPGADGLLDNNDFVVFINAFFALDPRADVGHQGGLSGSDGYLDNNDFVVFIDRFFVGC